MSDSFIFFFRDNNDITCFYDIKFKSNVNRDVLLDVMNVVEIDFNMDEKEDLIVTDKSSIVSQFVSSGNEIFNSLGINVVYFRKCRVYKKEVVEYDKMTEIALTLDEYIEYRNLLDVEDLEQFDNVEEHDKSDSRVDIFSREIQQNFDNQELEYYQNLFKKLERNPTFTEYFDILQSNSEHARHWFFNGIYRKEINGRFETIADKDGNNTLMRMIKSTLYNIDRYLTRVNSLVAFRDNSSVIKGEDVVYFTALSSNKYYFISRRMNPVLTAETHNFPTLISPFHGAHTGVGGRIRDNQATGLGANVLTSLAGYCVGDIKEELNSRLTENKKKQLYSIYKTPLSILIEASNGASDYGNKFGEPIIGGFTRAFSTENIQDSNGKNPERIEWVKPIMFSAGIGSISDENVEKKLVKPGMFVIRIGGPAYKIGLGGGFASSLDQEDMDNDSNQSAVQRGDPQMANRLNNVLRYLIDNDNLIISIHDQGSGGLGNVVKEIVHPYGADIYLHKVTLGDNTMEGWEIWSSEFQESNVIVVEKTKLNKLEYVCKKENICLDIIGIINNSTNIRVEFKDKIIYDLPINEVVKPKLQKEYLLEETGYCFNKNEISPLDCSLFYPFLSKVLQNLDVCSKRFLVNKVDRSVTGLVVQQQSVGPFQTPISNYSLTATSFFSEVGIASAIGERPILGLIDSDACANMTVGEMITNMMGVYVGELTNIKCSGNWMWALSKKGESDKLVSTAMSMIKAMKCLGLSIDGGKDSLSMKTTIHGKDVYSPNNLVLTGYAHVKNFKKRVTPDLKRTDSNLIYIKFSEKERIAGSVYQRERGKIGGEPPNLNMDDLARLSNTWEIIQKMIYKNEILSLHDVSDGGLITTVTEMAISGDKGVEIFINKNPSKINDYLFNEELGIIVEVRQPYLHTLCNYLDRRKVKFEYLGKTKSKKELTIKNKNAIFFGAHLDNLREFWERTSSKLEYKQMAEVKAKQQEELRYYSEPMFFRLTDKIYDECFNKPFVNILRDGPKMAVIRCEGSNGHRELAAAFSMEKFSVTDVHINDLIETPELLESFKGIAFPGGFSFSDTFGAAKGWGSLIKYSPGLYTELQKFYARSDTFSIGICNGCQLMINFDLFNISEKEKEKKSNVRLVENDSKRFESRFVTVKVPKSNSIFFKNLEDTEFGMWVAHGEGKFENVSSNDNIALQYVYEGNPTRMYPYNPNGSEKGIAALSSQNGRHLAIMPHPERCFLEWQLPYKGIYTNIEESPWVHIFRNAYKFANKKRKTL